MTARKGAAAITAVVGALVVTVPGLASPPVSGSGTGTVTSRVILSSRQAGENVIQERENRGTVTGTLTGTWVEEAHGVIHPTGRVTFAGVMTFTGTVDGCGSGTLTLGFSGHGIVGAPVTESRVSVIHEGGSTLRVEGEGIVHETGPALTYELHLHC
jgi:hypothetical protein